MKNLEALKKWIETILKIGPYLIIFEIIIGSIMAVASSQVKELNSLWFAVLIFSIGIFIALNIFKFLSDKAFPKLLIENIENEIKKDNLSKSFARKSLINEAIASSLIGLNEQTCKLSYNSGGVYLDQEEITNRMCDKDIEDGISNLINSLLTNMHLILESFNSKLTIGTYLKYIATENENRTDLDYKTGIYTLRNDLKLNQLLDYNLLENPGLKEEKLEFQNILKTSLQNNRFHKDFLSIEDTQYIIICSPIPVVCDENDVDGLFFVIGKDMEEIPNDIDEVFKIFNRVIANWISKYNDCVNSRIVYRNEN